MHNIKQLSLGYYVFHGADHSRFGHMIGAMHLAGKAFESMKHNSEEIGDSFDATDKDLRTIRIAALLHDIGHPPFSHSLESLLDDKHEKYSQALIDNYFKDAIEAADVKVEDIKNLIDGAYPPRPYLNKIVSGQLDVDRLDYLLRDSYYCGVSYGKYDLERIIDQLCVFNGKFAVMEGGYEAVEQLIFARHQMYQQVYFHKTKRAFELMLWKCGKILKDKGMLEFPLLKELETTDGIAKFVECDDRWFLNKIFDKDNPEEVKTIANMIKVRHPYLQTYSPTTYRKKRETPKPGPDNSIEVLEPIETQLLKKLGELGIEEHEFFVDKTSRAPYQLMPDYNISEDGDGGGNEGNSIMIFYKNNQFLEPIEKRSFVVDTLARNLPLMMRGFVIPGKYEKIRGFLETNFNYHLPKREVDSTE